MSEIELKYAPRKCKHFCCGDCTLDGKSCGYDIDDDTVCIEKYDKLKQALQEIKEICNFCAKEFALCDNCKFKNNCYFDIDTGINKITGFNVARVVKKIISEVGL